MPDHPYNVLFLCAGNSARSIFAEAILNKEAGGCFMAYSAGSNPKDKVHPYTLDLLKSLKHPVDGLRSKNWDEFAAAKAPSMDFVFTVCDDALAEVCPVWPGHPMTAHWGMPDPVQTTGTEAEVRLAFADSYRMLKNRIAAFINLPVTSLDRLRLQRNVDQIGKSKA